MSQTKQTVTPDELQSWTLYDPDRQVINHYDSRSEAEEKQEKARNGLGMDPDLYLPGEMPPGFPVADETDSEGDGSDDTDDADEDAVTAEIIDHATDGEDAHEPEYQELDARSIDEDPLDWVPTEFVDRIDGSVAINRKGYEVLSHFYGIDVHTEILVPPEKTDHEYCRAKATAITEDGRECEAHGSAHVDRDDDSHLLLEMADTRARKRSLSIATGVGAVAVEELRSASE